MFIYNYIKRILDKSFIKQLIYYFLIGLCAALVEWVSFWLFNEPLGLNIFISTVIAFILATFVNWVVGRNTMFRNAAKKKKAGIDAAAIYIVSGVGFGLNLLLMALFVDVLNIYPLLSKIIATGIVFMWNFLSRKYIVYKQEQ